MSIKKKVIIRHVNAETLEPMKDFYNNKSNHDRFAFENGINFYPTVVLMNNYGVALEKKIGIVDLDYYWTGLDQLIDKATNKLKQQINAKL
ncbi:hypothetical protein [Candidatus Thioglobus sp.]|uniref:hypothetical protein n=1 Tax=Candidatus Thioglobus sp. TaxID=2026721 RepID=UPI003D14A495